MTSEALPKVGDTKFQELRGVRAVADYCLDTEHIWRELKEVDVGLDGHIEFRNAKGEATGKVIAVQVKSGPSYFASETEEGWRFTPEPKHVNYWERYPLPVILVLHDPAAKLSYWLDARQALRQPDRAPGPLIVPRSQVLQNTSAVDLFQNAGVLDRPYLDDLGAVADALATTAYPADDFPVSFLDLFAAGLTNLCRSIYFGMDLALELAQARQIALKTAHYGTSPDHDFLFTFIEFLVSQNLADINFSDCLIDWTDRQLLPHFVAPLTARGRALIRVIDGREADHVEAGELWDGEGRKVAQEAFFGMDMDSFSKRIPRILCFSALEARAVAQRSKP